MQHVQCPTTQELRTRVDKSGRVGADVVEGGDSDGDGDDGSAGGTGGGDSEAKPRKRKEPQRHKDATHTWEFCQGNLSVLLWDDLSRVMGVSEGATTDRIFANEIRLDGTSLPRGTGVTSSDGKSSGDVRGTRHGSSKRKQAEERSEAGKERSEVMSTADDAF